jgi:predicted tellurium resistance membrane protein TerC
MFMRIALLFTLAWMVGMTEPLFTVWREEISGRDLILIAGGLFLIWKATGEIHGLVQGEEHGEERKMAHTFAGVLAQIAIIDLVFSLDSIITAVGMVDDIEVMVAAVVASVALMMAAAGPIGRFVSAHPTVKTLALSFLIMVGMALVADGLDFHVPKGYIYFAMAFSIAVEMLNLRMRRNASLTKK